MNKAFKVLWNQVRNTYVVASEAQTTHGKPGKATKTIVAAAVAGLMAMGSSAFASTTIDNNSFGGKEDQYDSTKFISGNGGEIYIQTSGDARELAYAIKSGTLDAIQNALGANKDESGNFEVTLVGFAGGQNFIDSSTGHAINSLNDLANNPLAGLFIPEEYKDIIHKIHSLTDDGKHFNVQTADETNLLGDITLNVGAEVSSEL